VGVSSSVSETDSAVVFPAQLSELHTTEQELHQAETAMGHLKQVSQQHDEMWT
jgi:hypothetical protein